LENIISIEDVAEFRVDEVREILNSLIGEIKYTPPKFSAKKIGGKRAYALAREDREVELKEISSTIYKIKLLLYNHPFITFEYYISEGGYIRSIGQLISQSLGVVGTLSYLRRVREGKFSSRVEVFKPLRGFKSPQKRF